MTPRRDRNPRGQGKQLAQDIVTAAHAIIEETGDESRVSLSEIARRVGIAVPSIYDHFSGVDEIRRQVVTRAWDAYASAVLGTSEPAVPPAESIGGFARAYVAFARSHPGSYRILFSRSGASPMPEIGQGARASFDDLVGTFAESFGVDRRSPEARAAAVGFWVHLHGIASLPPAHPRFEWPGDDQLVADALRRWIQR